MATTDTTFTDDEEEIIIKSVPTIFSWGRGDMGALLRMKDDEKSFDGVYVYSNASRIILQISSNEYHTACITSTGDVLLCGSNEEGQVSIDYTENEVKKPRLLDLGNHRITSISVGLYHTALVTASGVALTLGGNEVGQLGHSVAKKSKVGVAKVDFHVRSKNAIVVKQVCCGDLFSLFLTTTGEVYGCGLGNCLGNPHDADVAVADRVEGLLGSNIVAISCGSSHSLALSSNGELYAWGANQHNQLGVEGLVHVQTPTLVPVAKDIGRIVGISCGASHSLAWTDTGKLIGTGSNKYGQLGGIVLPRVTQFTVLETFGSSSGRCIQVSCGKTHSLVLFDEIIVENDYLHVQEVWASGSNSNQQVDTLSTSSMIRQPISLTSFQNNWDIRRVAYIAAGGDQSFVVAITEGTERPDSMLQKRFSTQVSKSIVPMSTIELHYLILEAQRNAMPMFTILNTMGEIFSSSSLLSASFRVPNSVTTDLSVDVIGLEECYGGLMQLGNAAVVKLLSSLQNTLTDLESVVVPTSSTSGEQKQLCHIPDSVIRTLLIVWLCPVNSNAILSSDIMLKLARIICMMPPSLRAKLLDLISVIPLHLVVSRIIKPVQETLSLIVDKADDGNIDPNLPLFCILLNWLYSLPTLKDAVPVDEWYNKSISKLSDELLLRDFLGWKDFHFKKVSGQEQPKQKPFFFANHPFILSVDAKKRILIAESRLQQLNAQQQAFMRGGVMQGGRMYIQPWLILTVQRENLLQSTLAGIESCVEGDLKKPLKVIFEAEEGIDEGGVAKEFFQLLVAQLFAVQYGMFTPTSDGRALWINRASVWNSEQEFHLVGVLLGLAVYNGVLLDIHVPKVFYRKLLIRSPTLADLASVDPDLAKGLAQLIEYEPANEVEDVFCRTFSYEYDLFGETKCVELIPDGKNIPVNGENRKQYVESFIQWYLVDSIQVQFDALFRGFTKAVSPSSLLLLSPEELELLMVGTPHLNFSELEQHTAYIGDENWGPNCAAVQYFWSVLHEMELEDKQRFLRFVTGSSKAPLGGLGNLGLKIQRMGPDSDQLPTSHTCFNTILIPEYSSRQKTKERLLKAITECEGFGLK